MAEAVASLRSAIEPFMKPTKGDERTAGQRAHDALMELCRRSARGRGDVAGVQGDVAGRETAAPRTLLVVTASVDTLAGIPGAPAGELQGGGMVPAETVRRIACDTAVTTAPPAGVTYASAAVRSPPITSSISSGQSESATASNYAIGAPPDQTGEACESATSRRQS